MIIYMLKSLVCSGCLYLVYHLFLEQERMYRFNRFYLLFSIIFSFSIPLMELRPNTGLPEISPSQNIPLSYYIQSAAPDKTEPLATSGTFNTWPDVLIGCYLLVSALLLARFLRNLYMLFKKVRHQQAIPYHEARLILNVESTGSHSFLNYIFVDRQSYLAGKVHFQILDHELSHVRQKHTLDILFLEILFALAWFNPVLLLYRKAILLNHEFLADESVLKSHQDTAGYQELLLSEILSANEFNITSKFNYSVTKKRLIMMKKQANIKTALLKQFSLIPVLTVAVFIFCGSAEAQQSPQTTSKRSSIAVIQKTKDNKVKSNEVLFGIGKKGTYTRVGVSDNLMAEYRQLASNFKFDTEHLKGFLTKGTAAQEDRMVVIWKQMSLAQQREQAVSFSPKMNPLTATQVTENQLATWKNPTYGVWIDGKRVSNEALDNYNASDFSHSTISKLYGAAKKENRTYQVDLMTTSRLKAFNQKLKNDPEYILLYSMNRYTK